jgi:hypothetical protein
VSVPEFRPFAKIPRLVRDMIVTEKIDGTNGVIYIPDAVEQTTLGYPRILAGSRNKWVEPGKQDNMGFATWVVLNADILIEGLGPGTHHGEWYGKGIQRNYGLDEKRFALFNPKHYAVAEAARAKGVALYTVPVLYDGMFDLMKVDQYLERLRVFGSVAVPGFMDPEGVIVFHTAGRNLFKRTIKGDEKPKGSSE